MNELEFKLTADFDFVTVEITGATFTFENNDRNEGLLDFFVTLDENIKKLQHDSTRKV